MTIITCRCDARLSACEPCGERFDDVAASFGWRRAGKFWRCPHCQDDAPAPIVAEQLQGGARAAAA